MQFPDTPATRTTEAIMAELCHVMPLKDTATYNRAFTAVYRVLSGSDTVESPCNPEPENIDAPAPRSPFSKSLLAAMQDASGAGRASR